MEKSFLSEDDIPIGKQVIYDCFEREKALMAHSGAPLTRVTDAVVHPNKWSKMNVSFALIAFEHKTLAEISSHLYDKLGIGRKNCLCGDDFKVQCRGHDHLILGFYSSVGKHLHQLTKNHKGALTQATRS